MRFLPACLALALLALGCKRAATEKTNAAPATSAAASVAASAPASPSPVFGVPSGTVNNGPGTFECSRGGCTQTCPATGPCTASCSGGSCYQTCPAGAVCNFSCSGGACKQVCTGQCMTRTCTGNNCS